MLELCLVGAMLVGQLHASEVRSSAVPVADAIRGGQLPLPLPLFPPSNWWNVDIRGAPVDPNSAAYIAFIGATRGLHPDFGGESGDPDYPIYGMPYVIVEGTQALVPVVFD